MRPSHRIHLPLVTNDGDKYVVGDPTRYLLPGELWEIDNRHRHSVRSNGTEGRVHMIMDFVLPGEKIAGVTGEILECWISILGYIAGEGIDKLNAQANQIWADITDHAVAYFQNANARNLNNL